MGLAETLIDRLEDAWRRSDRLFALVPEHDLLVQPIALRHPLLFYVGHLPAFASNQICRGVLGRPSHRPELDDLFERGIDPVGVDRHEAATEWPALAEVLEYRDRVREALREAVPEVLERAGSHPLAARGRIVSVVLEHEYMHHETLLYMLQQMPPEAKIRPDDVPPLRFDGARRHEVVEVEGGEARLGAAFEDIDFGWDNEFPEHRVAVGGFRVDRLPVTTGDWLEFVEAGGYRRPELWSADDWRWRERSGLEHPATWAPAGGGYEVVTMFDRVPLEQAAVWPVSVSLAEARAFCRLHDRRLPTEAELHLAMYGPAGDGRRFPWGDAAPQPGVHGNFGLESWAPAPAGAFPAGDSAAGLADTVGHGWQWTATPFAGFPGFEAYIPSYPGYSADFFDGLHNVMLGASWATPAPLVRRSFRNWFQGHYPYVFSTFRTVHP